MIVWTEDVERGYAIATRRDHMISGPVTTDRHRRIFFLYDHQPLDTLEQEGFEVEVHLPKGELS